MQEPAVYTANIVVENLEMLREAARRADVEYRLVSESTLTAHDDESFTYSFHPVFCSSPDDARALQASYKALIVVGAIPIPAPGRDSFVLL